MEDSSLLGLVVDDSRIILVNIYATNDANQQVTFFKELQNRLADYVEENIIVAGDFNCALSEKDKKGGNTVQKKARAIKEINHFIHLYNLSDIWRFHNPDAERFTWRNKSENPMPTRFFLISKDLNTDVQSCNIVNSPESDHSAIALHLKSENLMQPIGPGFWKFNSSLLEDRQYVDKLRENKYSDVQDLSLKWTSLKWRFMVFQSNFQRSKLKNEKMKNLFSKTTQTCY